MPGTVLKSRAGVVVLLGALAAGAAGQVAQEVPKGHDSKIGAECRKCRTAYQKALDHTLARLPQARFPAKMIMGWLLLADGRHPKELAQVIGEAKRWKQQAGADEPHNHRRNWYPALAGMLLLGCDRFDPDPASRKVVQAIVDHFAAVQERTGGWFKWHEGAYNDRPDYPVKDLGILDAIILGLLHEARAHGAHVPGDVLQRAEACVGKLLSADGISYGTGSGGGDTTGARGAFAMSGLLYAGQKEHPIVRTYVKLLPRRIPELQKGHHVGGLHGLGVVLGCHLLGPEVYRELTDRWLDVLIGMQVPDGGVYIGDDGDAGGEKGLLGEDDASTAAFALMILLQDPARLRPGRRPHINWLALDLPRPRSAKFLPAATWAAQGKLDRVLELVDRELGRRSALGPDEVQDAESLKQAVEAFVARRLEEAERSIEERDLLRALEMLEPLAAALPRHAAGTKARELQGRIATDATLRAEHAAQKDLEAAWDLAAKRGMPKALAAFEAVSRNHAGTRAADRARQIASPAVGR